MFHACAAPHKGKRAIELSLHMAKVNEGLGAESLTAGLQLAACVRSIEDHGFLLSLGIQVDWQPLRLCYVKMILYMYASMGLQLSQPLQDAISWPYAFKLASYVLKSLEYLRPRKDDYGGTCQWSFKDSSMHDQDDVACTGHVCFPGANKLDKGVRGPE